MATVKKTVKETVEVKATPVKKEAAKVETKAAEVKVEKVEKAAPAKKAAAKTTAAKTTAAKAPAKAPAKKAAAKKTSAKDVKVSMNVQFGGKSYTTEDLVKIAKDVWKYDLKQKTADFKSVDLYVKPEDGMAYYVINGKEAGSFYI